MPAEYGYLNQAITNMLAKITSVGGVIDSAMQPIFFAVGVLLFTLACTKFLWQRDLSPLAAFVIRYIQLMALVFVSGQWMPLTDGYISQMGNFGANAAGFDILQLAPSTVMIRGLELANKMYSENVSWMRLVFGSTEDTVAHLLLLVGCLGTILLAVFMAAWVMLFFVVFKLASVIAMIFLAFMVFDATRFMAAPGIARIMAYGVQMLVLGLVSGLFFMTLDGLDMSGHLEVEQSLALLAVMFFFGLLFKYTTDIAREQISGMPSLSLHDTGQLAGRAAGTAASMVGGAAGMALGALSGARLAIPAGRTAAAIPGASSGGSGGGGGLIAFPSSPGGGGGGRMIGATPQAAFRMMNKPHEYAEWTPARDLPKSASRLIEGQKAIEGSTPPQLPPPAKQLPPPRS